jgi:DNA-binding LytR/AlgR family response regulator
MDINIAVCDDEQQQALYIKMLASKWANESGAKASIDMFDSAESFKAASGGGKKYDFLLLDIQMGGQNGVELAREIRQSDTRLAIIFITGFSDYMSDGYDVSALHYLTKPVNESKLFEVLDKAHKSVKKEPEFLTLSIKGRDIFIPLCDIVYIESSLNYVIVNTTKEQHRAKMPLAEIEDKLGGGFFRCTRSFIAGLRYVRIVTKKEIILTTGTSISLGRGLYEKINNALIKHF